MAACVCVRLLYSLQRYHHDSEQLCLMWGEVESLLLESSAPARATAFHIMDAISEYHRERAGALRWEFVKVLRNHCADYRVMQHSLAVLVDDGAAVDPLGPAVVAVLLRWLVDSGAWA
jgi:hypothetical protein